MGVLWNLLEGKFRGIIARMGNISPVGITGLVGPGEGGIFNKCKKRRKLEQLCQSVFSWVFVEAA